MEVRAVHDGQRVYFAIKWEDPSRSLRRVPVIKKADGWHFLATRVDVADVNDFYEDKLALGFSRSPTFGSGEATLSRHQAARPTSRPRFTAWAITTRPPAI